MGMIDSADHQAWRLRVASAVVERRPPDDDLAAHLASCAACTDEWRRASAASARLIAASRALPLDAEPPARLRERLRAELAAAGRETGATAVDGRPPREPEPRLRRWAPRLAWALSGALVASVVGLLIAAGTTREDSSPPPVTLTLVGTQLAPELTGTAELHPYADGTVHVTVAMTGMPASAPGEFYEVWLVGPSGRVSAGSFRCDGSPVRYDLMTAADLAVYPRIGITREPADGDPRPSDQRVATST